MPVPASGFTRPAVEAEADNALAERDPVAAAVNLFDRGTYFQCNFEPDTAVESAHDAGCQVLMSVKLLVQAVRFVRQLVASQTPAGRGS